MLRASWILLKTMLIESWEDRISRMSAALAFYAVFSIGPMLLLAIKVTAAFLGEQAAEKAIRQGMGALLGREPAIAIEDMLREASLLGSGGGLVTILGVIALLWAIISLFIELHDSMDIIWGVQLTRHHGWQATFRHWLLSFIVMLGTGVAMISSLGLSAVLASVSGQMGGDIWQRASGSVCSFIIFTLLFAALYKWLPEVKVSWRDVWRGGAVTAGLLVLGEYLVALYVGRPRIMSVYGAVGSVAILLIWVYYSAHALFLGVEFTQVYARLSRERIEPEQGAEWTSDEDRAKQGASPQQKTRMEDGR